ncbi:MAG: ABC transporter permease [Planctomycetota bacterium]|jgi:nitrate/nitrite transport system permease protein
MKYKLIKAIDVAGLTFLTPVVRLCYGEEPKKQLGDIGRFIVVPLIAFVIFVGLWGIIAPRHKTKSGEVPTPLVVWDAASSIWRFHDREADKEDAYGLSGKTREQKLAIVEKRLSQLDPLEKLADEHVAKAHTAHESSVDQLTAPILAKYEQLDGEFSAEQAERQASLQQDAETLASADRAAREAYLHRTRDHAAQTELERETLKELKAEETAIRAEKFPQLVNALKAQTRIAEERQYLGKLAEQLGRANRTLKLEEQMGQLRADQVAFLSAEGDAAYTLAQRIVRQEERITKTSESTYAKPWTLPMQIYRSLACVFVGFLIGSAIAIPIGVLCGLSKTFMAAMTPFIALFKPVSPIVWLPIALIVVGGFIPDPDKHWLIDFLANLPLLGWMKINPAFIASAITVALCSLWATMTNTALGVASIDKDHLNVARVLRLGFKDRLFKIVIPSSLPLIFAGLRISLGVGWMVLIAAELLSSSEGIGKFVWDQFNNGASDSFAKMMVVVFVVGLIGLALDRIMIVFQRLVSFDDAAAAI